jgi:hypothetical protein
MSQENVEIVRRANEPHNREDMVPLIRQSVEHIDDWSDADAVVAEFADDPNGRQMHPDVEWDASALGPFDVAHGLYGMAVFWREWVEVWESYVYEMREYRDLGDWVLTVHDLRARGRGGIPVEIRAAAQLWKVRDGKIAVVRVFGSATEALKAAGLEE